MRIVSQPIGSAIRTEAAATAPVSAIVRAMIAAVREENAVSSAAERSPATTTAR